MRCDAHARSGELGRRHAGRRAHALQIDGAYKERFLNGVDDIGLVLQHVPAIKAYETRRRLEKPWLPPKASVT
jgi:3-isopropylmalate dehydratase small subunit